uniref:Uncharacterized protein n=1 Tax=Ascaris lumbricoides TaxID=6252 RepID=A0A0M3HNL3_ASCLU
MNDLNVVRRGKQWRENGAKRSLTVYVRAFFLLWHSRRRGGDAVRPRLHLIRPSVVGGAWLRGASALRGDRAGKVSIRWSVWLCLQVVEYGVIEFRISHPAVLPSSIEMRSDYHKRVYTEKSCCGT